MWNFFVCESYMNENCFSMNFPAGNLNQQIYSQKKYLPWNKYLKMQSIDQTKHNLIQYKLSLTRVSPVIFKTNSSV